MPKYTAVVHINIKPAVVNPEEPVVTRKLGEMGYKVQKITMGKCHVIVFEAETKDQAAELVKQMCERILTNRVTEIFSIQSILENREEAKSV